MNTQNSLDKLRTKYLIPTAFWTVFIFWASVTSVKTLPSFSFELLIQPDKLAHLTVYAILVVLTLWGLKKSVKQVPTKWVGWTFCLGILYGFFIECVQYTFFPGRYFEIFDIIANIIGCLTGILLYKLFIKEKL